MLSGLVKSFGFDRPAHSSSKINHTKENSIHKEQQQQQQQQQQRQQQQRQKQYQQYQQQRDTDASSLKSYSGDNEQADYSDDHDARSVHSISPTNSLSISDPSLSTTLNGSTTLNEGSKLKSNLNYYLTSKQQNQNNNTNNVSSETQNGTASAGTGKTFFGLWSPKSWLPSSNGSNSSTRTTSTNRRPSICSIASSTGSNTSVSSCNIEPSSYCIVNNSNQDLLKTSLPYLSRSGLLEQTGTSTTATLAPILNTEVISGKFSPNCGSATSSTVLQKANYTSTNPITTPRVSSPVPTAKQSNNYQQKKQKELENHKKEESVVKSVNAVERTVLGKLKVKILDSKDLNIPIPYVVCTYDSSEYVTSSTMIGIPSNLKRSIAPKAWTDETQFDVTFEKAELDISIYEGSKHQFMGHINVQPDLSKTTFIDNWYPLEPREGEAVAGEIRIQIYYERTKNKKIGPEDFEVIRLLGKGTFGQVFQVRKRDTRRIYAMKVLSKKVIVQKREIAHTVGERDIMVRTANSKFIVGLKFSFQTPENLYLVTDFMSGGELFWHLQKEGKFKEERAKFYIAELIIALEQLHDSGIVYRDLKPENILLDANGHIALCDFGLSKGDLVNNNSTTNTFCGTTEYLAPEVVLDDSGYTKMVDFWSLGVLVFEMCCGWSPFYAEDTQQMYKNIAFGKVRFPKDSVSTECRNFVKGLLNRNPAHRLGSHGGARELKSHPFFEGIDWEAMSQKQISPPFKPVLQNETDVSNFDPEFTQASTSALKKALVGTPLSPGMQAKFGGFTYIEESTFPSPGRGRWESEKEDDRHSEIAEEDSVDDDEDDFVERFEM